MMSPPDLLLAVDGGGTKTRALVTDLEGNVLARGLGPSSNLHSVGFEQFATALTTAVDGALLSVLSHRSDAGGPGWRSGRIAAACFGLAGVDSPEDEAQISQWVSEQGIAPAFLVVNDAELILAGGTPEGWGVGLISGTGSVCLGRSPDGRTARVGGWGGLLSDEGSGYHVAMRALRLAVQTADGRADATAVLRAALRHWSLPHPQALIRYVNALGTTPSDIAGLAPVVLDLAAQGDAWARVIMDEAARDLAHHVQTVVRKLALSRPPLALAGGLLRGSLRQALISAIGGEVGAVSYIAEPALGAVVLARRLLTRPRVSV